MEVWDVVVRVSQHTPTRKQTKCKQMKVSLTWHRVTLELVATLPIKVNLKKASQTTVTHFLPPSLQMLQANQCIVMAAERHQGSQKQDRTQDIMSCEWGIHISHRSLIAIQNYGQGLCAFTLSKKHSELIWRFLVADEWSAT